MPKVHYILFLFGYLASSLMLAAISYGSDPVKADLIAEVQSIRPGRSFSVGVLLEMEKGWHTYWLNPGDSGLPVVISWKLPPGFIPGDIQWPYPFRFGSESVVNFGYEEEVLLITDIEASPTVNQGETIIIEADVEWLVCKEECLPGKASLSMRLAVEDREPASNPLWTEKFADTRKKLPITLQYWPAHAALDTDHVELRISSPSWFKNEMRDVRFFPEQPELFKYSTPQLFEKTDTGYTIRIKLSALAKKIPSKLKGVLVSDRSWSRASENKALQVVVPLVQMNEETTIQKEVSR
jgi:DsbC/DsbD-like thiol-disulfide interchange protein